jgi:hypothetical protein
LAPYAIYYRSHTLLKRQCVDFIYYFLWHTSCNHIFQVARLASFSELVVNKIMQEFPMSVSSRLLAFVAAVIITAVSFAGPTYATPHQVAATSITR